MARAARTGGRRALAPVKSGAQGLGWLAQEVEQDSEANPTPAYYPRSCCRVPARVWRLCRGGEPAQDSEARLRTGGGLPAGQGREGGALGRSLAGRGGRVALWLWWGLPIWPPHCLRLLCGARPRVEAPTFVRGQGRCGVFCFPATAPGGACTRSRLCCCFSLWLRGVRAAIGPEVHCRLPPAHAFPL